MWEHPMIYARVGRRTRSITANGNTTCITREVQWPIGNRGDYEWKTVNVFMTVTNSLVSVCTE